MNLQQAIILMHIARRRHNAAANEYDRGCCKGEHRRKHVHTRYLTAMRAHVAAIDEAHSHMMPSGEEL